MQQPLCQWGSGRMTQARRQSVTGKHWSVLSCRVHVTYQNKHFQTLQGRPNTQTLKCTSTL